MTTFVPVVQEAQFPRPCTTKEALNNKTCCPIWGDSPCGTKSGRGICASYMGEGLHPNIIDYRVNWPGNDTTLLDNYECQNTSVCNLYAWMHNYAAKSYANSSINAAHRGPAFGFWHRIFLLFIEREIRDVTGNQNFFYTILGLDPYKPLYPALPTVEDVLHTRAKDYDTLPYDHTAIRSFRNKLEGFDIPRDSRNLNSSMHNLVHDYMSGTLSDVTTAANDPIFMLHHSFIDKILEDWLTENVKAKYPISDDVHISQNARSYMVPFFPLRRNSYYWGLAVRDLGYTYNEG
ncbi:tyrosinase-like [Aplochiton taeniatus]